MPHDGQRPSDPKVLLCDDEVHVRSILERRFARAGWQVLTARHGVEALEVAGEHLPDVIVMDFQMPELDGVHAARELAQREGTSQTPIILLSGQGHLIADQELTDTRVLHVIPKPFSAGDVVSLAGQLRDDSRGRAA